MITKPVGRSFLDDAGRERKAEALLELRLKPRLGPPVLQEEELQARFLAVLA